MEPLKHECGVAMIRLLKPLEYYQEKYGTWMFGLNKLYLMMEKQHNRGQEGAGMACVKLDGQPGTEYMFRERAEGKDAITEIFGRVQKEFAGLSPELLADADFAKEHLPFAGELYMTLALLHYRKEGSVVRTSLPAPQQLAGQEPVHLRQLQYDQYRRDIPEDAHTRHVSTHLQRRIHVARTDGTPT